MMNEYLKNLDRIEFVVTMACTGRCIHCSEGDHEGYTEHIDADVAVEAIRKVCAHYPIRTLMTFGGEPLLYPDTICRIHAAATDLGISKRQVITNGYFSKNRERIEKVAMDLAASGVNNLLLSVDAFHQETIPLEPVLYFAECAVKAGIPVKLSPAWLVSREDDNPYNVRTRQILREFDSLQIPLGSGNVVFPSGNALKYLGEYFDTNVEESSPYEEDPLDVRTLSFAPNGDVLNGNVCRTDILEIIRTYRPSVTGTELNSPELVTDRLILRKFTPADLEALHLILSDEEVNVFLPWFPMKSLDETKAFYESRYAEKYRQPRAYAYAVCLRENNIPIGYIAVDTKEPYELGYGLRKEFWGRGIMTEAAKALIAQVRKDGDIPYITATHDAKNLRSGRVMQKAGMKYCYSYHEFWQPKGIPVVFRMYQLNLSADESFVCNVYWERFEEHFIEEGLS